MNFIYRTAFNACKILPFKQLMGRLSVSNNLVSPHPCWRANGQLYKSSMVFSNPIVIQRSFHQTSPEKNIPKITSSYENTVLEKGNIMLLGPTGAGKRTMAQLIAKKLDLPLSISWAGDHIKNIIGKLLRQVNYDVERAQTAGVVFLHGIDDISCLHESRRLRKIDFGGKSTELFCGKSVQEGMLQMLEGTVINVPAKKFRWNRTVKVDTTDIMFIASGVFTGLDRIINHRINQNSLGSRAEMDSEMRNRRADTSTDSYYTDIEKENAERDELFKKVEPRDLYEFGMLPEFVKKFPDLAPFQYLNRNTLFDILTEPKNGIVKQFKLLFSLRNVQLTFTDDALRAIASQALEKKMGAQGLIEILASILSDPIRIVPGSDIVIIHITEDVVNGKIKPYYNRRQR